MSENNSNEPTVEERAAAEQQAPTESEMVYKGKIFSVRVDHITPPDGPTYKREIIVHSGAVVMVPVDQEGNLLLVKQWRRAANRIMIELPAGTLEKMSNLWNVPNANYRKKQATPRSSSLHWGDFLAHQAFAPNIYIFL